MFRRFLCAGFALGLAAAALGQVQINEVLIDGPGTDQGQEFFELISSSPNFSLTGLTFVAIDGDGTNAGVIDQAIPLSAFSTGSNGLFLRRDTATVLNPAPAPGTTVSIADFSPDLENGSNTFLIVSNFSGAVNLDLDTNNDGTFDVATPWTLVSDAIAIVENDGAANYGYADDAGFANFPAFAAFNPDAIQRYNGTWWAFDVTGAAPGPYTNDPLESGDISGGSVSGSWTLTPGSTNIPEPASAALLAIGVLAAFRRR